MSLFLCLSGWYFIEAILSKSVVKSERFGKKITRNDHIWRVVYTSGILNLFHTMTEDYFIE